MLRTVRLRGGQEYLPVYERVKWMRRDHPGAVVTTDLVHLDASVVVVRATVSLPETGAVGTGTALYYLTEEDALEKAETKAVGRALRFLGFDVGMDEDEPMEVTSSPQAPPALPPRRGGSAPAPAPQPQAHPARHEGGEPVVSWTEFWRWAREHGFRTKTDVEQALGGPMRDLPPHEVRRLLEATL